MSTRSAAELYEEDFYAWTQLQAKELRRFARTRPNLFLDLSHIAEEIADLGTEQRSRIRSWTRRIVEHLLLLAHSLAQEPRRGWIAEVVNFRREIDDHLSATLRRDLRRQFPRLYDTARADLQKKLRLCGEIETAPRSARALPLHARPGAWRLLARAPREPREIGLNRDGCCVLGRGLVGSASGGDL